MVDQSNIKGKKDHCVNLKCYGIVLCGNQYYFRNKGPTVCQYFCNEIFNCRKVVHMHDDIKNYCNSC